MKPISQYCILSLVLLLSLTVSLLSVAQSSKVQARWNQQVSLQFGDISLRESLESIAKSQKVDVLLDRRIDPGMAVDWKTKQSPLKEALVQLAESLDLDFYMVGSVAYLGPRGSAAKLHWSLSQHREFLSSFPSTFSKAYLESGSWSCDRLATPHDVLAHLAEKQKVHWNNLGQLPHDLLPALRFQEITHCELLALLLIGFDMTFSISEDGRAWTLVPFSELPVQPLKVEMISSTSSGNPQDFQSSQSPRSSQSTQSSQPSRTTKSSKKESVKEKEVPIAKRRFTLRVENQRIIDILRSLADRLEVKLEVDGAALQKNAVSLDQRVSFDVDEVTAQELIRTALKSTPCSFSLKEKTLRITVDSKR